MAHWVKVLGANPDDLKCAHGGKRELIPQKLSFDPYQYVVACAQKRTTVSHNEETHSAEYVLLPYRKCKGLVSEA